MLAVNQLTKTYTRRGTTIQAADGIDLDFPAGSFTVIYGASGSGKSSLLLMLGGMLRPSQGIVSYRDNNIYADNGFNLREYRKNTVGFVFQKFFLVPYLSVFDNIRLPLTLSGNNQPDERIRELADRFGISGRLDHLPHELSVGEQQRAALSRALATTPRIILADEPTGNIDRENSDIVVSALQSECEKGRIIVMVTHDDSLLNAGTRKFRIADGRVVPE